MIVQLFKKIWGWFQNLLSKINEKARAEILQFENDQKTMRESKKINKNMIQPLRKVHDIHFVMEHKWLRLMHDHQLYLT